MIRELRNSRTAGNNDKVHIHCTQTQLHKKFEAEFECSVCAFYRCHLPFLSFWARVSFMDCHVPVLVATFRNNSLNVCRMPRPGNLPRHGVHITSVFVLFHVFVCVCIPVLCISCSCLLFAVLSCLLTLFWQNKDTHSLTQTHLLSITLAGL